MRSGELRHAIIIETVTETQTASGSLSESWAPYATVWADMQPMRSTETFQADQDYAQRDTKFIIRYQSGITHKMRINYSGRIFDIKTLINLKERNRTIEIIAREAAA